MLADAGFALREVSVTASDAERLADWVREELDRPFDRYAEPLVRATIGSLPDGSHVFLLGIDHLVCDGWSLRIILTELTQRYQAGVSGGPVPAAGPAGQLPELPERRRELAALAGRSAGAALLA